VDNRGGGLQPVLPVRAGRHRGHGQPAAGVQARP
jgi:hypothetical protein